MGGRSASGSASPISTLAGTSTMFSALIGNARLALTEAMHGAIVADTFRVPFVPLVSSREISSFKWMDWALRMDIPYRPIRLPPVRWSMPYATGWSPLIGHGTSASARSSIETRRRGSDVGRPKCSQQLARDIAARGEHGLGTIFSRNACAPGSAAREACPSKRVRRPREVARSTPSGHVRPRLLAVRCRPRAFSATIASLPTGAAGWSRNWPRCAAAGRAGRCIGLGRECSA